MCDTPITNHHHSANIADMESSAADSSLCSALHRDNKRKYKENAFTAKAESGTLKVKIMRRDQKSVDNVVDILSSLAPSKTKSRRAARQPQSISDSPPKPRPNRKHVPIFYEPQFRQTIKRKGGHSSSMDDTVTHTTSTSDVPDIHSTSSTEVSAASGTAALTSSTTLQIMSPLSDVRPLLTSSSGGDVDLSPRTNPLFVRNDSDEQGTLSDLLRSYLPSSGPSGLHSVPLKGAQPPGTTSSAGLVDQTIGLTSALHQLASSSALYRSAMDKLSTVQPSISSSAGKPTAASTAKISASSASATTTTLVKKSAYNRTNEGLGNYRFDPLSALQTAIDHARRASSAKETANQENDKHREIGSTHSNTHFYRLEPSGFCGTAHNDGKASTVTSLGVPPELSPCFALQNSLLGGGIHRPIQFKLPVNVDGDKIPVLSDDSAKDTVTALGPPPDATPSLLLQNSLTGGGISLLNLPRTHPSLDRRGSLTTLISQANETAKGLKSALAPQSETHLSLDRPISITSLANEDSDTGKSMSLMASCPSASAPETGSTSLITTPDTVSNGTVDLGPPPNVPPAFTIGNSLMGGGIELPPVAANVNTHNFDWKLHRAASNTGEDANFRPKVTREISHELRARPERSLASSRNTTDKE